MKPFLTVYSEVSIDGKTTHRRGASSKGMMSFEDDAIRRYRHELRAHNDAIMVGSNTIRIDDPYLTARYGSGPSPLRVVPTVMADLPITSNIFNDGAKTLVVTTEAAPSQRVVELRERGVAVEVLSGIEVNLDSLLMNLYDAGIRALMVEGGATLLAALFRGGHVNRLIVQHLPVIFGGEDVPSMVGGKAIENISDALALNLSSVSKVGAHAVIIYDAA